MPRVRGDHARSVINSSGFPVLLLEVLEHFPGEQGRCKIKAKNYPEKNNGENVIP